MCADRVDFPHVQLALNPPLRTASLEGIGGDLKTHPEDFQVTEIPAYAPSGSGDHLWVTIQKIDLDHGELLLRIANTLNLRDKEIGYAGAKDKRAITTQVITLPAHVEDRIHALESEAVRVVDVDRHDHRIRMGHLRGNSFSLILRNAHPEAEARARRILEALSPVGFPNYYGIQRFGRDGKNITRGLKLLGLINRGKKIQRRFHNVMALSSVQSWLFNLAVARRAEQGNFDRAMLGDVLKKRATGGLFVAEDLSAETPRVQAGEVVPTGPIFGRKMWWPDADSGDFERAVLAEAELSEDAFAKTRKLMLGTRRPIAIMPDGLQASLRDDGHLQLNFILPKGSYATVLLRELMKDQPQEKTEAESTDD